MPKFTVQTVRRWKAGYSESCKSGEYQAGLRGNSWKLDLIQAINEALEYATSRESFIENKEIEGYEVFWSDSRKHITFTCPNGRKCRDSSLHDETFLKETWRRCSSTVRPQASVPRRRSRTRGGSSPRRPPGQTANSAAARPSRKWPWARSSAATSTGSKPCDPL